MRRILAAIGNLLGIALGILSIPIALFMGLFFSALPVIFALWFLGIWPVDNNTNEAIVQPTPSWVQGDCDRLAALIDEGTFGQACLEEVGEDRYEVRRQLWLDLITEKDLSADEALAGFYAWLDQQGENCRIWIEIQAAFALCP